MHNLDTSKNRVSKSTEELNIFICKAATALQRHAARSPDFEIPSWCVTSFEVDFDVEIESRVIGRGAFGHVLEGTWNGSVCIQRFDCVSLR